MLCGCGGGEHVSKLRFILRTYEAGSVGSSVNRRGPQKW